MLSTNKPIPAERKILRIQGSKGHTLPQESELGM